MSRANPSRFQKFLLCGLGLLSLTLLCALPVVLLHGTYPVPSFVQVRGGYTQSESILLDRHGKPLHELRTDDRGRRLDWVQFGDISPALQQAILAAEDRRFYQHRGVDWMSFAGALVSFLHSGSRGASTITMQLAAKLDAKLQPSGSHRTLGQKWNQMRAALALEQSWTKEQIIEAYLNLVSFRGELQGLAAAAGGLFGKEPHGLGYVESLILAALVPSPNAPVDQIVTRACRLAESLNWSTPRSEIEALADRVLNRPYFIQPRIALAPHVAQRMMEEARSRSGKPPKQTQCTIDRDLQQFVLETLRRHVLGVRSQNVHDGAVLVLDNATGEVLSYVGNIGDDASARYVDGARALRQAGSTLKPFIYGAAFEQRILTAASVLEDSAVDIPVEGGVYRPSNYDRIFHGPVTAREALASSLNVPAVRTLGLVGLNVVVDVLRTAGFEHLRSPEFYGPSLALGAVDVTLYELTNAYRCLANGGLWSPVRFTPDSDPGLRRRVLSPQAAFIVLDILSDRESRDRTFGLESPLATRFWTAVKTGTSKDMRDNWCIGVSDRYTVGVWVGNFSGEPMWNVSGMSGAAPVWVDIMNWLHRSRPGKPPLPPAMLVRRSSGKQGFGEWFIRGTEDAILKELGAGVLRIAYPAHGTIFALDPDIPLEEQKLFFEAQPKDKSLRWMLDGQPLGSAGELVMWTPVRGKHVLALVDVSGRTVDSVTFEVRGNL